MPDLIPLEKLITRLKTDLQLSSSYEKKWGEPVRCRTKVKNRTKASLLYYLEELRQLKQS